MKRIARYALVLMLIGIALAGALPARAASSVDTLPLVPSPITAQALEQFFDTSLVQQMEEERIVGATVAVVKDGELMFAKGYGYADFEQQVPVYADQTLFYPGSAGKLFTWTAVLQQVEQGKLDLHADIQRYLDFSLPATFDQPITLHHLLTHTAGFEEQLNALLVRDQADLLPLATFVQRYLPRRVYPPGEVLAYSNYGTALAGYIVERVSGEPFEQYITNHILVPLHMTRSAAVQPLPPALARAFSKGYRTAGEGYRAWPFEWVAASPAAPVHTTATDMAHFLIAHLEQGQYGGQSILRPQTVALMQEQHFTHDERLSGWAYGFAVGRENGQRLLWHNGESARFTTIVTLLPAQRVGLFVSFNTAGADWQRVQRAFLDQFYPTSDTVTPMKQGSLKQRAAALNGTYVRTRTAFSSHQKLVQWLQANQVRVVDDVTLEVGGLRYVEVERGLFREVDGDRQIVFRSDARGQVTHMFRGPLAFFKVPWYQTPTTHAAFLGAVLVLLVGGLIGWPLDGLRRRRRAAPLPRGAAWARWLALLLGAVTVSLLGWYLAALFSFADTYVYPNAQITLIARFAWLLVPLTLTVAWCASVAWRRGYWNLLWRIHYTLLALGAIGLLWSLHFWKLLAV